jgi:putative ABC transport system ATP-binding protein
METSTEKSERSSSQEKAKSVNGQPMVELRGVTKVFYRGKEELRVLDGIDLEVAEGSFEALMGPSGSGKSTLLNLIAGLDRVSSGTARVAKRDLTTMGDGELAKFRAQTVGFIFQAYNLMPVLTARENVELPLLLTNLPSAERKKRALTALRVVGLEDRTDHYPRQLSGGQEQRVAIARAIVTDPDLILADEPTGNLDARSGEEILQILSTLNRELNKTIVMVTHDPHAASFATHERHLEKGLLNERAVALV